MAADTETVSTSATNVQRLNERRHHQAIAWIECFVVEYMSVKIGLCLNAVRSESSIGGVVHACKSKISMSSDVFLHSPGQFLVGRHASQS